VLRSQIGCAEIDEMVFGGHVALPLPVTARIDNLSDSCRLSYWRVEAGTNHVCVYP
jgi:hypothetical protein